MSRHIFHLAFPVNDLETSCTFYTEGLGGSVGRRNSAWLDILIWGHQITLHQRPAEVPASGAHGVRHFGAVLPWAEWEQTIRSLETKGVPLASKPLVSFPGTPEEQGKFYVEDPSGNGIELKAYRSFNAVFGVKKEESSTV